MPETKTKGLAIAQESFDNNVTVPHKALPESLITPSITLETVFFATDLASSSEFLATCPINSSASLIACFSALYFKIPW